MATRLGTSDVLLSIHEKNAQLNTQIKAFKKTPGDISGIVRQLSAVQADLSSAVSQLGVYDSHIQILNQAIAQTQAKVEKLQNRFPPPQVVSVSSSMTPEQRMADRAKSQGFISFYDDATDSLTGCFGNFHPCPNPIEFGGKYYSNSEAIFQSRKFTDNSSTFNQFTQATVGDTAVKLGQSTMSSSMLARWDSIKDDEMMNALRAKFGQNPTLKAMLMATGDAYLVEHLPSPRRDKYWSDAFDGSGKNMLGICLMRLRKEYGGTGEVGKHANYLSMLQSSAPSQVSTTSSLEGRCIQCHNWPKFVESSGKVHDYCSKTCAQLAQSTASTPSPSLQGRCIQCHIKPKFVESSGRVHDYCGRQCAKAAGVL